MAEEIFNIPAGPAAAKIATALMKRSEEIRLRLQSRLAGEIQDSQAAAQLNALDCVSRVIRHLKQAAPPAAAPGLPTPPDNMAYSLRHLLTTYGIVRIVAMEEAPIGMGRPLTDAERMTLNIAISVAGQTHILEYVDYSAREIRAQSSVYAHHLSYLSHELHGGLNGVLMMLEVLKNDLGNQKRFAGTINDLRLVQQSIFETMGAMDSLIEVDRLEFDEASSQLTRLDAAAVAQEVGRRFEPWATARGLKLEIEASAAEVNTDRALLIIILQQLIANAIKFAAAGTVKVAAGPMSGGGARIAVADEGHGLTAKEMAHLTVAPKKWIGKGVESRLAIARKTAAVLRAKLFAQSKPGGPNRLILELPPR